MADEAIERFFDLAGVEPRAVGWRIEGEVPPSRGLGSSVTLRLGLLAALNAAHERPLAAQALYQACSDLEGHPDNAAPAQFGGFISALPDTHYLRFEVGGELKFVLLVPEFGIETAAARSVLPEMVPRRDALSNTAHAALLTAAFAARRYEMLRHAFHDRLHQHYRLPLLPELDDVIAAGVAAGALGGFLSGSGSTICCAALDNPQAVGRAMQAAMPARASRVLTVAACNSGATAGPLEESGLVTA